MRARGVARRRTRWIFFGGDEGAGLVGGGLMLVWPVQIIVSWGLGERGKEGLGCGVQREEGRVGVCDEVVGSMVSRRLTVCGVGGIIKDYVS
ncbi:hypothetical protein BDV06DRAFT_208282 [Aspergillus oleicola]